MLRVIDCCSSSVVFRRWIKSVVGLSGASHQRHYSVSNAPNKSDEFYLEILSRFPVDGISLGFAYGSAVFKQGGNTAGGNKMYDFLFVVEDSLKWHRENMSLNPRDYSPFIGKCGPALVADLQEKFGARFWFNTLIPIGNDNKIKYGVINREHFLNDLYDWETLYAGGRLHKPVKLITLNEKDSEINLALRMNIVSALHAALLLLPGSFSERELYSTLTSLSYTGDFRMVIGEDKNKVRNIVDPNIDYFRRLYEKPLDNLKDFVALKSSDTYEQDISPGGRHYHLTMLPRNLQWNVVKEWNKDGRNRDVEDVLRAAAFDQDSIPEIISNGVQRIVQRTALTQALKGILSAGLLKSIKYSGEKLKNMFKSMK